MKILIAEDDAETGDYLRKGLTGEGHAVDLLRDGREALTQATAQSYDLFIFDRMMPGLDGLALLKALRAAQIATPAILLTAMGSVEDRVAGLRAGADDYMVKPFAFIELLARVGMLLGRASQKASGTVARLAAGELTIDLLSRECFRQGQKIRLTSTEFKLLEYLMRHPKRLVTRTMLLDKVWGLNFDPTTSVVETHISRLRSKIDNPFEHKMIETLRGDGYVFDA